MQNFDYRCPTRIVFGRGEIARLADLIPTDRHVLMVYGGGSIKRNGVYEQVTDALSGHRVTEFGGIPPNPKYDICVDAIRTITESGCDFVLAVGGGSVLDACKFIGAAALYDGPDPWDLLRDNSLTPGMLPLGAVLTLPATGSEMNPNAVISRADTHEKLAVIHPALYPDFSILDPATTLTLPRRQTVNGILDSWVHVLEQYATYPAGAPLQDRLSEAVLATIRDTAPVLLEEPDTYEARADLMWSATLALNGLLAAGVPQDWATHQIGHELTAFYGLDHAVTLAVVLGGVWRHQLPRKQAKLAQYARRIWGVTETDDAEAAELAIEHTDHFFHTLGVATTLAGHNVPPEACEHIGARFEERGGHLGEHQAITGAEVEEILRLRL